MVDGWSASLGGPTSQNGVRPVVGEVRCEATQGEAPISVGFLLPWHSGLTGSYRPGGWWWEAQRKEYK